MQSEKIRKYWGSQLLGWGLVHGFLALQSIQAVVTGQETLPRVLVLSPASWLITVLASHCLYLWAVREAVSAKHVRQYWPALLQLIVLVALVAAVLYWVLLQGLSFFLPPPETRSATIAGVFDSFLLFILNFTLVNCVLMALWWACFMMLARHDLARQDTGFRAPPAHPPPAALDVDSPIMISDGKSSRLITPSHIEYAFAEGNYVKLVGAELNMLVRNTLSHLEQRLTTARFFRINRQTLVNLTKVKAIEEALSGNYLLILESGKEIEASRRQGKELQKLLSL
jgi:hypothetical protein